MTASNCKPVLTSKRIPLRLPEWNPPTQGPSRAALLTLGFCGLILAACTGPAQISAPATTAPASSTEEPAKPVQETVSQAASRKETKSASLFSDSGRTPRAPKVDARPERFLGMRDVKLVDLLGEPYLLRQEGEAQVWQYRQPECVLDLYLYPQGAQTTVIHLEARDIEARPENSEACLHRLLTERAKLATLS